jgi:hypothetical protein
MVETTLELISSHVASGARLMARQKQIIAELEGEGVLILAKPSAQSPSFPRALGVFEKQWLAILKKQNNA